MAWRSSARSFPISSSVRVWEVRSFYARILLRAWRARDPFDPGRSLEWLRKRAVFEGGISNSGAGGLRDAMRDTPDRSTAIARHFFRTVAIDEHRWHSYHRFREAMMLEPDVDAMLDIAVEEMAGSEAGERQLFLYEIAFALSYQAAHAHAILHALEMRPCSEWTMRATVVFLSGRKVLHRQ